MLDIVSSAIGLILFFPFLLVFALLIKAGSKGPVFYSQERIGQKLIPFRMHKFRTMYVDSDKSGLLTVGGRDPRITGFGYWLRRFKLDELPQLWNVLVGEMSLVGPRPEVRKYVDLYTEDQRQVLSVKPGITDWASLMFRNENQMLDNADDPEEFYIKEVMPVKLSMNLDYIERRTFWMDLEIIFRTVFSIPRKPKGKIDALPVSSAVKESAVKENV